MRIPDSWYRPLARHLAGVGVDSLMQRIDAFVTRQRREHTVYPPAGQELQALETTPPERVRVVILGQDPYHGEGQAHGLAFSVAPGVKPPPSLVNIFRELRSDVGVEASDGCLLPWARQGVLLLNTVLTVRQGEPHSHRGQGWEELTDAVVAHLAERSEPIVFLLWGKPAEKKGGQVRPPHAVLSSPHPSPLSARRGFFGSRPFSTANRLLEAAGREPIDWSLSER